MATRNVTSIIQKPDGEVWAGAVVQFRLVPGSYTATVQYPPRVVTATTDEYGVLTAALWTNEVGETASEYVCTLPSSSTPDGGTIPGETFSFTLPAGAGDIELSLVRLAGVVESDPQYDTLITWVLAQWKGTWAIGTAYDKGDKVYHEGSSYIAVADTVAGQEPGVHASWGLFAPGFDVESDETVTGLWTFAHASGIKTDVVTERTVGAGVTIDGLLIKDGVIGLSGLAGYGAAGGYLRSTGSAWARVSGVAVADVTDFAEAVDDRVAALVQNGGGITWTYDDVGGTLTPAVALAWSQITSGVPTTLSGYGITDAVSDTELAAWPGSSFITTVGTLSSGSVPYSLLTSLPTATHAVYVAKNGNDASTGLGEDRPKLTIGAAVTAAAALIVAGATAVRIEVLDGGTYTESVTLAAGMILNAPAATLVGALTLASDTHALVRDHYASAGGQTVVSKSGATGYATYRADRLDGRGTGGALTGTQCVSNVSNGSVLFAHVGQVWVAESGVGIGDAAAGFGYVHFWAPDLYLAGDSAIGIRAQTANSDVIGYIDHILETGSPTAAVGISLSNASAIVKATVSEIRCTDGSAYVITNGSLHLVCPKVVGTRTGTPVAEISDVAILGSMAWLGAAVGATKGGTGLTSWALGDLPYASALNTLAALPGNITATRKFLRQVGNGAVSAAPAWDTLTAADVAAGTFPSGAFAFQGALSGITTLGLSGQLTSTLATGAAPFVVASTTVVANLNVSQLLGATWAAPAAIGSGTPAAGAFTTLSASGLTKVAGGLVGGIGTALQTGFLGVVPTVQIQGTSTASDSYFGAFRYQDVAAGPNFAYHKSRGGLGAHTIVQSGDALGAFTFSGSDGVAFIRAATILAEVDGTPGLNDMPGRLVFQVTPDGGTSPAEAMRLSQNKAATFAGTLTAADNVGLASTKKLYFDGVAMTGDTYITESSANVLDLYAGAAKQLSLTATGATVAGALGVGGWITAPNAKGLLITTTTALDKIAIQLDASNIFQISETGFPVKVNDALTIVGTTYIGDTSNANCTLGLTINQGAADNVIVGLKSSDVTTALTSATTQAVETDDFATFGKISSTRGGLLLQSLAEDAALANVTRIASYGGTADTTKTTAGRALIELYASEHNGANALADVTADGNVFGVIARRGGADVALMLLDEDADLWLGGALACGAITSNGGLQTFLANDSAGAGFRYVVVPNA